MMYKKSELQPLGDKLSQMLKMGNIIDIHESPMATYEKGFSGAELLRIECGFDDGKKESFVCKKAELKERMVMRTLTDQGHSCTPATYSEDCVSNESMWMVQQDLGKRIPAPHNDRKWMGKVAHALAEIHVNNMDRGDEMPWLPHADAAYWTKIVTQISVSHFEKAVYEDARFAQQFESILPSLQAAGRQFVSAMASLYEESRWLTLTHGDLQSIDGDHIYNVNGCPYIIDFGFARYAPFYIDLVDYFSLENAFLYHQALTDKGLYIHPKDFEERFRIAYKYPGFIYMFPSIIQWKRGSEGRLISLLSRIFNG